MQTTHTRFPRLAFRGAAIYGVIALLPQYFLEARVGLDFPPPITHPEYFYGFVGLALVWQLAFWLIGSDPLRYRPLMPIAVLEKASFGVAALLLFLADRAPSPILAAGLLDLTLGVLFVVAWRRTPVAVAA